MRQICWAAVCLAVSACQPLVEPSSLRGNTSGGTDVHTSSTDPLSTHLLLSGVPAAVAAGTVLTVTVTAQDSNNDPDSGYTGAVHFYSTDAQAHLPNDAHLVAGTHTFALQLLTAAAQTVQVSAVSDDAQSGSGTVTVSASTLAGLLVSGYPSTAVAGQLGSLTVTGVDAYANKVAAYTGTVHFVSSDTQAVLPADLAITNGTGTTANTAQLVTAGMQTVGAQDTATSLAGNQNVVVGASGASPTTSTLVATPAAVVADGNTPTTLTATVRDMYGNAIANTPVVFSATGSGVLLAPSTVSTNSEGVATTQLRATVVETKTIGASFASQAISNNVTFLRAPCSSFAFTAGTPLNSNVMSRIQGLALGDLNGDGKPDLAVTDYNISALFIFMNTGNGNFSAPTIFQNASAAGASHPGITTVSSGLSGSNAVVIFDYDNDGKNDLATADWGNGSSPTVTVFHNTGNGTFAYKTSFQGNGGLVALTAADLNNDGKVDLVTANQLNRSVNILINGGSGSFTKNSYALNANSTAVAARDMDNDGNVDLLFTTNSNQLLVLHNNGGGTGLSYTKATSTSMTPVWLDTGDFNGDGKADVVTASASFPALNEAEVFINSSGTLPASGVSYPTGAGPVGVAVNDFDIDGKLDIVTSNAGSNNASVLGGNGNGTFKGAVYFTSGSAPYAVATGDLDGDGKADFAVSNQDDNTVYLFMNTCN